MKYKKIKGYSCDVPVPMTEAFIDKKLVLARLDTGADISVIPMNVLEDKEVSRNIRVRHFSGDIKRYDVYDIELEVFGDKHKLEVLGTEHDIMLLGLDILRKYKITFGKDEYYVEKVEELFQNKESIEEYNKFRAKSSPELR